MENKYNIDHALKTVFTDDISEYFETKMENKIDRIIDQLIISKNKRNVEFINLTQFLTPLKQLSFSIFSVFLMFTGVYYQLYGSSDKLSSNIQIINRFSFVLEKINTKLYYKVYNKNLIENIRGDKIKTIIKNNGTFNSIQNKIIINSIIKDYTPDIFAEIKYFKVLDNGKFIIYWGKGENQ